LESPDGLSASAFDSGPDVGVLDCAPLPDDNMVDYYDPSGRSTRKFLLRKPIAEGEMTSPFGMRYHPILHFYRMHTGVDCARRSARRSSLRATASSSKLDGMPAMGAGSKFITPTAT
jgi:murein DD-endopeptidase MepM/ murein hydrolase activator NlpD